jgi:hypothetical protein
MNARASMVDTWRLIEFNANDLQSQLNLVFSGDVRNVGDNPVDFRSATGQLRVGAQFDAPLTRIAERNNYRQSLIEYQQARRNYYTFIDRVSQTIRQGLRGMELNEANFELRRAAVRVGIDQVELTRLRLRQPPQPGVVAALSNTTARDLVSALSDLQSVQNDFLSVWVNNEVERMNLDFNMGTMQLDNRGMWVDPGSAVGTNAIDPYAWLAAGLCGPQALRPASQWAPEEVKPGESAPKTDDGEAPPPPPPQLLPTGEEMPSPPQALPPQALPPQTRPPALPGQVEPQAMQPQGLRWPAKVLADLPPNRAGASGRVDANRSQVWPAAHQEPVNASASNPLR